MLHFNPKGLKQCDESTIQGRNAAATELWIEVFFSHDSLDEQRTTERLGFKLKSKLYAQTILPKGNPPWPDKKKQKTNKTHQTSTQRKRKEQQEDDRWFPLCSLANQHSVFLCWLLARKLITLVCLETTRDGLWKGPPRRGTLNVCLRETPERLFTLLTLFLYLSVRSSVRGGWEQQLLSAWAVSI